MPIYAACAEVEGSKWTIAVRVSIAEVIDGCMRYPLRFIACHCEAGEA